MIEVEFILCVIRNCIGAAYYIVKMIREYKNSK